MTIRQIRKSSFHQPPLALAATNSSSVVKVQLVGVLFSCGYAPGAEGTEENWKNLQNDREGKKKSSKNLEKKSFIFYHHFAL